MRRPPTPARRLAVTLALVAGVVLAGPVVPADAQSTVPPAGSGPTKRATTPMFSARRVPDLLRSHIADESVAKVVKEATKDEPPSSCVVITDHGRLIQNLNGDVPLLPASVNKLLTATTALKVLGADTRLTTSFKGNAADAAGVVTGDVYLVGGGDSLLSTPGFQASREYKDQPFNEFNQLADRIQAAGIKQINGNILGDDSRYDAERAVATWPPNYQRDEQVGALSALQVNWGETGLEADPNKTARVRKLADPPTTAAATLKTLLQQRGIVVNGQPLSGAVPPGSPAVELAKLDSQTVGEMVDEMLSFSDNNTAEHLAKEIGLKVSGQGTTKAGVAAITAHMNEIGMPMAGVLVVDGSGLDRNNHLTCNLVAALLDRAGPDSVLANSLAVTGQKGTLKKRMKGQFGEGRVKGKTGTLKDVVSLAGFEKTIPGTDLTFVTIQNGNSVPGTKVHDDLINGLLTYPQAPDDTKIGPKPVT